MADEKKPAAKRAHKATFARDKKKGGYLIRVEGPNAAMFAGKVVPVTLREGDEHEEQLDGLIWSGIDNESGKPVALYSFVAKEREKQEVEF